MRVDGQDPILKLIQQLNLKDVSSLDETKNQKTEEAMKEVRQLLLERDQVLLRGEKDGVEVQFSRKPGESPESYFQRVSTELLNQKGLEKTRTGEEAQERRDLLGAMSQTALHHGLAKEAQKRAHPVEPANRATPSHRRLLWILVLVMLASIVLTILNKL